MKNLRLVIGIVVILAIVCSPVLAISMSDLIAQYRGQSVPTIPIPIQTSTPTTVPTTAPTQSPLGAQTSESYVCELQWGSHDPKDGQATQLMGIAVDGSGNIFVVEWGNHRIQKYGPDGTFITKWEYNTPLDNLETCPYLEQMKNAMVNTTEEELISACQHWQPRDIAVDGSGNVYVSDNEHFVPYCTRDDRILKFSSDATFITSWGSYGSGDGQFDNPHGVAIDSSGNVYVADVGNNRIQKFSSDGTFITAFGSGGTGIAVDGSGNVYVLESSSVKKFSSDGTFITAWGSKGSGDGQFSIPLGIAVDGSGNVYVADHGNHRIQKFSSEGLFLTKWETDGCPYDVAVDGSGNVYVTDSCNDRIQKFIRNSNPESDIPTMIPTTTATTTIPTGQSVPTTPTPVTPSSYVMPTFDDDFLERHRVPIPTIVRPTIPTTTPTTPTPSPTPVTPSSYIMPSSDGDTPICCDGTIFERHRAPNYTVIQNIAIGLKEYPLPF